MSEAIPGLIQDIAQRVAHAPAGADPEAVAAFIESIPKAEWDHMTGRYEVAAAIRRHFKAVPG
jgi:hypothetical protein